jgi:peptidyl-prolyl cis-trans isomerase D
LIDAVLRADAAKLPVVVGADLGPQGYAVARIAKVLGRDPAAGDARQLSGQYAQAWADAETMAYYNALKTRFKVDIKAAPAADATPEKAATAATK